MPNVPSEFESSPSVTITTGARLHFGPLSIGAPTGREFGGWGLMIDGPQCGVVCEYSPTDEIQCSAEIRKRVEQIRDVVRQRATDSRPLKIAVKSEIPGHLGLGSGTQLGMAVSAAVSQLLQKSFSLEVLAQMSGRGSRSAVGIYGFSSGGLLVDAGHWRDGSLGAIVSQKLVPSEWRFLLISPSGRTGLAGALEKSAFQKLPPMTDELSGRLCRILLTEILPAVDQNDFATFAAALTEYSERVGRYFAPIQNGVFSWPVPDSLLSIVREHRLGVAQSSWGPTLAIACPNEHAAAEAAEQLRNTSENDGLLLNVRMTKPRNIPAAGLAITTVNPRRGARL